MDNYSGITRKDVENIGDKKFFEDMSKENLDFLKRALSEAIDSNISKILEETNNIEIPIHSKRYKQRMNSLFREQVGGSFLPFPEEDNL